MNVTTRYFPLQKGSRVLLVTGAVATFVFITLSPVDIHTPLMDNPDLSVTLRFIAQSLLVFVSFGVFLINWMPPARPKDLQSVFIAGAFLSTGLLTLAHMMTCRELLNVLEGGDDPIGSYFHLISGATMGVGLAVAAFLPRGRRDRKGERRLVLSGFLTYTAIVIAIPVLYAHSIPPLCPHEAPDSLLRIVAEAVIALALVIAVVKYYALHRETKDMIFAYLATATLLGVFSHLAFTEHDNAYDIYSAMSICYSIASYSFVFLALFRGGVIRPYEMLNRTRNQLDRRRKEAEAATVKAQTYLDFLSHDIANMVSPIMSRAEMIVQSENVSEKEKEEAKKIVEQAEKMSSLIQNLRRLASAERIDAKTLGPVDLRVLFAELERSRREGNPNIDLKVTTHFPEDTDVKIRGGSVSEEIIAEIVDNAIKHANRETVEVEVSVRDGEGDSPERDWTIEIQDNGPGIPDQTKKALDIASPDPKRRFTRGIASSLSVIPLIAEQLGGRIRIEDRVPGDHTHGTRVIITLPRAE